MKSVDSDDIELICKMYDDGKTGTEIAAMFGLHRTTIPKLYKRHRGITGKLTPHQGNMSYFQTIDSHIKAYFLGFIAADGCIVESKTNSGHRDTLAINILSKDRTVLDTLKRELGSELAIHYFENKDQVSFRVCNQQICDDLRQYGLGYRKSLTMPNLYPLIPSKFHASFTLGYHDGDGCMYWKKTRYVSKRGYVKTYVNPVITICGTKEFLLGMADFLKPKQFLISKKKSIFSLDINSKEDVQLFMDTVYKDCTFYLKRKYDKYYEIPQDQTISSSESSSESGARVPIIA